MFDVLEARVNRAILSKLSNAMAAIGAASPVAVIFDAEFKTGMVGIVGMGASAPQMYMSSADAPSSMVGADVTVNGAAWVVAERKPDGDQPTGLTLVVLEKP